MVHTHTYRDTLHSREKNRIMPFAGTWINLETFIQSEVSQNEKNKYHRISFMCGI